MGPCRGGDWPGVRGCRTRERVSACWTLPAREWRQDVSPEGGGHMKRPRTSKHVLLVLAICSLLATALLIGGTQSRALSGMPEATLNLLWLSVALAASGCFRLRRRALSAAPRSRFGRLYGRPALGCALVLLFPVLSITEDLHAQPAVTAGSF